MDTLEVLKNIKGIEGTESIDGVENNLEKLEQLASELNLGNTDVDVDVGAIYNVPHTETIISSATNNIFLILSELLAFFVVLFAIEHILSSIGLYKIAKRSGIKHSWLAWIPGFNVYMIGKIGANSLFGWILLGLTIVASCFSSSLQILAIIIAIVIYLCLIIALNGIYKKLSTKSTIMTIFTALFIFLAPIFLLAIRNNSFVNKNQ